MEQVSKKELLEYYTSNPDKLVADNNNAKLVFSPEHIPFFPDVKRDFNLTFLETLLYGFIRFYRGNKKTGAKFYFTNEQLAKILSCSVKTIKRSVKILKDKKLIKTKIHTRVGGGTIRFVEGVKMYPL